MKKGFVIVFLVLFSFLLSAQGVKEICIGVNEYAKNLRSAYYEAEISFNTKEDMALYQKDQYHCEVVKPYMHAARLTSVSVDYILD